MGKNQNLTESYAVSHFFNESMLMFPIKHIRQGVKTLRVTVMTKWAKLLCNGNQLDALFILSLFRQSTSTCFGHICSPSSGGTLYVYSNWYVLCFLVACLLAEWPTDRQLKSTTATNFCVCVYIYIYIYSIPPDDGLQLCPKHVEVD